VTAERAPRLWAVKPAQAIVGAPFQEPQKAVSAQGYSRRQWPEASRSSQEALHRHHGRRGFPANRPGSKRRQFGILGVRIRGVLTFKMPKNTIPVSVMAGPNENQICNLQSISPSIEGKLCGENTASWRAPKTRTLSLPLWRAKEAYSKL